MKTQGKLNVNLLLHHMTSGDCNWYWH